MAAVLKPKAFLKPLVLFMALHGAYKIVSVAACNWLAAVTPARAARSHLGVVAACWLATLALLVGVRALSGPFPGARERD